MAAGRRHAGGTPVRGLLDLTASHRLPSVRMLPAGVSAGAEGWRATLDLTSAPTRRLDDVSAIRQSRVRARDGRRTTSSGPASELAAPCDDISLGATSAAAERKRGRPPGTADGTARARIGTIRPTGKSARDQGIPSPIHVDTLHAAFLDTG